MKKILTLLTASVFVMAILIASACSSSTKEEAKGDQEAIPETDTITSEDFPVIFGNDSTHVGISLKDTIISCKRRLVMQNYDIKGLRGKKEVDSLITEVYPGYTVHWALEKHTNIHKIRQVRLINTVTWDPIDTCLVAEEAREFSGSLTLEIPDSAKASLVKYEIIFEDTDHMFWCIDPYLRIKGTRSK